MRKRRNGDRAAADALMVAYRRALVLAGVDVGARCACGGALRWQPVGVVVELAWELGAGAGGLVLAEDAVAHGGDDSSPTSDVQAVRRRGAVVLVGGRDVRRRRVPHAAGAGLGTGPAVDAGALGLPRAGGTPRGSPFACS